VWDDPYGFTRRAGLRKRGDANRDWRLLLQGQDRVYESGAIRVHGDLVPTDLTDARAAGEIARHAA
jgi:hypothetical protein